MPPSLFPALPLDICGEIYNATAREIRDESAPGEPLEAVFANGDAEPRILTVDSIPAALDDNGLSVGAWSLLIAPGPIVETRIGNDNYTELKTGVDLGLLTPVSSITQHHDWARQRIFRQIKRRLLREGGTLRSGAGLPSDPRITEALQGFGRIEPSGRLKRSTNILLTTFRVTFSSDIDGVTGDFLG